MSFLVEIIGIEYIFRILISGICGIMIGIERRNRSKEAGTRTHFMVACGASLIMIVSKYAFFDVISQDLYGAEVRLDPSRVASTIASGIGFLGAGMIFIHKNNIKGLTTAAGIWVTSGVGMAIGAGMYSVGIVSTGIVIVAQILLHLRGGSRKQMKTKNITVKNVTSSNYQDYMTLAFDNIGVKVIDVSVDKIGELRNYSFAIEYSRDIREDDILSVVEYDCSIINDI